MREKGLLDECGSRLTDIFLEDMMRWSGDMGQLSFMGGRERTYFSQLVLNGVLCESRLLLSTLGTPELNNCETDTPLCLSS